MISLETLPLMISPSRTVSHMMVSCSSFGRSVSFVVAVQSTILFNIEGELPKQNTTTPSLTTQAPSVQPHTCPDGMFACQAHGECVAHECDFRQDCSDGLDELNCGETLLFIISLRKTFYVPPTHLHLFLFSLVQLRSSVILKVVKCAAGSMFNPLLPPPMHFFGHLTRERAFMMERSSIVLSLTTHCEYQAARNTQSVQFSQLICHLLSNYQYYCK